MAYIQDISLLMRELLKVPKDYTPTAMEISKYIKSRYSNDKDIGKRPMGTRGFSSGPSGVAPKRMDAPPLTIYAPPPRLAAKRRVSGRNVSFSSIHPNAFKKQPAKKNENMGSLGCEFSSTSPAFTTILCGFTLSLHGYKSLQAKNQIRRAVSEIASMPAAKTKLSELADKHKMDPNLEVALEKQRKEMLKYMLEPGADRAEPVRTREIIQKLMEDNKLEVQRREIAKLTELARAKVLEARKAMYTRNARKREMEYAP